jgi:hypothetical protein
MTLFEQPNITSHILTLFTSGLLIILLNTFCNEWSRIVRLCKEFLCIISFHVYTVSKTLFDATEHNLSFSHFRFIWTIFLLLNTFWHEWSRLVTPCNELLYIISFEEYTVSKTFFDATLNNLTDSQVLYIRTLFILLSIFWDVWSRILTLCNELVYKVSFNLYAVNVTRFDGT